VPPKQTAPRVEITCPICGAKFIVRESRGRVYCSKGCEGKATAAKYKAARIKRTCEVCGKVYAVRPSLGDSRFCSIRCKNPATSRETAAKRGDKLK
jgi:endogenous inhibitor of DNA gyrase (YacG/DUF329 family)